MAMDDIQNENPVWRFAHDRDVRAKSPFSLKAENVVYGIGEIRGTTVWGCHITGVPSAFAVGLPNGFDAANTVKNGNIISLANNSGNAELRLTQVGEKVETSIRMTANALRAQGGVLALPMRSRGMRFLHQPYLANGPALNVGYEPGENPADWEGPSTRPIELCDGYAVYHNQSNLRYLTIERAHIFDANGEGLISHPSGLGQVPAVRLVITDTEWRYEVDPTWLATATGQIIIDPNLGFDSIGATTGVATTRASGSRATEGGSSGTYDKAWVYCGTNTGTPVSMIFCLYTDSSGATTKIQESSQEALAFSSWNDFAFTSWASTASTNYWLMAQGQAGAVAGDRWVPHYDAVGNYETWDVAYYGAGGWPTTAPAPTTSGTNRLYSIYLEPAAGGAATNTGWYSSKGGWF